MSDNISYVAKWYEPRQYPENPFPNNTGKYKENPTPKDRIFEGVWYKTHKYLYYGLTRDQMIQIEKEGYIMPEEIHE